MAPGKKSQTVSQVPLSASFRRSQSEAHETIVTIHKCCVSRAHLQATAKFMELSMMRDRLPTRPALLTSRRGARTLKNTRSECTACSTLSTCTVSQHHCQYNCLRDRNDVQWLVCPRKHRVVDLQALEGSGKRTRHERRKMVSSSDTSVRMSKPRALNFGRCTKIALHSHAM